MTEIYVVIKCAKEATGEWVMATTEQAFKDQQAAQLWLSKHPTVWEETVGGSLCYCERAVHVTQLTE